MMYKVLLTKKALSSIANIPKSDADKIRCRIKELMLDPRPRWIEKLKGYQAYRMAVGNYRIIFEITDETQTISIVTIDHRRCVYRNL